MNTQKRSQKHEHDVIAANTETAVVVLYNDERGTRRYENVSAPSLTRINNLYDYLRNNKTGEYLFDNGYEEELDESGEYFERNVVVIWSF